MPANAPARTAAKAKNPMITVLFISGSLRRRKGAAAPRAAGSVSSSDLSARNWFRRGDLHLPPALIASQGSQRAPAHAFADVGRSETAVSRGGGSAAKWRVSPCFNIERPGQLHLTGLLTFPKFRRLR